VAQWQLLLLHRKPDSAFFHSHMAGWRNRSEYSGLGGGEKCAWVYTGKKGHALAQIAALQMNRMSWSTE